MKGQEDCFNPIVLTPPVITSGEMTTTERWFEFDADTTFYYIEVKNTAGGLFNIDSMVLYKNDCGNLTMMQWQTNIADSILWLSDTGFITGITYKLKITQPSGTTSDYILRIVSPQAGVNFLNDHIISYSPYTIEVCPGDTVFLAPIIHHSCYDPDSTVVIWEFFGAANYPVDYYPYDTIAVVLASGTYPFTYVLTNIYNGNDEPAGCQPAIHSIIVRDSINVDFTWLPDTTCAGNEVCFYSIGPYFPSSASSAGGEFINWYFGDGSFDNCPGGYPYAFCDSVACHTYIQPGNYSVTLSISDGLCQDMISKQIYVNPNCCLSEFDTTAGDILLDNTNTVSLGVNSYATSNYILIKGTLTINSNFSFINCPNVYLYPYARIIVTDSSKLTIQNSTLQAACDTMWDKIYVSGPTNSVFVNNSLIRDAITAIWSDSASVVQIANNSIFRDNHIHLQVTNCRGSWGGSVTSSTFETDNQFSGGSPLLYPYTGEVNSIAIFIHSVDDITIGGTQSGDGNLIKYWSEAGIYAQYSNVNVYNNEFSNKNIGTYANGKNAAIYASLNGNVAHTLKAYYNYIHDIKNGGFGINAEYGYQLIVLHNTIGSVTRGVKAYHCSDSVIINNNLLLYVNRGIWCIENPSVNYTQIKGNRILNDTTGMVYADHGIWVQENSGSANSVFISGNEITGAQYGIKAEICTNIVINNNSIALYDLAPFVNCPGTIFTARYVGIKADNCTSPTIFHNIVNNTSGNRRCYHGIQVKNGTNAFVCSNIVSNLENGIWFRGSSLDPSIIGNDSMAYVDIGFALDMNGEVGTQGGPGDPRGNRWYNHTWATYYDYSNHSQTANFWWKGSNGSSSDPSPNFSNPPAYENIPQNTTGTEDCQPGSSLPRLSHPETLNAMHKSRRVISIINDTILYPIYHESTRWWNYWTALGFIYEEGSTVDTLAGTLNRFIRNLKPKPICKLYRIDKIIREVLSDAIVTVNENSRLYAALQLNQNIHTQASPESAKKTVNEIDLKELIYPQSYSYTPQEIKALVDIANSCPFDYGPAVYQARVMLSKLDITVFEDNCSSTVDRSQNKMAQKSEDENHFKIYPNPVSNQLIIENDYSKESLILFTLMDFTGRTLINKFVTGSSLSYVKVNNMPSGVYFYKITVNTMPDITGKISIIR